MNEPEFWWVVEHWVPGVGIQDISRDEIRWNDLPDLGVLRVHIYHGDRSHAMAGFDNYWVDEDKRTYGFWTDEENLDWYPDPTEVTWAWVTLDSHERFPGKKPPVGVKSLAGVMIPDDEARELGLIE